jgi:hypothetical protein
MASALDKVLISNKCIAGTPFTYASLVMPTCRLDATVNFFREWSESFKDSLNDIHIVYDGPSSSIPEKIIQDIKSYNINTYIHSWDALFISDKVEDDIVRKMPSTLESLEVLGIKCFSRKDSAIRSYGFLIAATYAKLKSNNRLLPEDHIIYTLDDDCMPICDISENKTSFFNKHANNLLSFGSWSSTVPGIRVRGLPYYTKNRYNYSVKDVVMSMGTWKGIPDFDAAQRLSLGEGSDKVELPLLIESVMAHPGVLYPICGMNLAFRASMLPAALFAPMGTASNYKRFDDIWFGIFAQAVLSISKNNWCYGQPLIYHARLSGAMDCLVAEAPGIRLNESLWMYVRDSIDNYAKCGNSFNSNSIVKASEYVVKAMSHYKDTANTVFEKYDKECIDYITLWCECLSNWLSLTDRYVFSIKGVISA